MANNIYKMVISKASSVDSSGKPGEQSVLDDIFPVIRGIRHEFLETDPHVYLWIAFGFGDYTRYDLRKGEELNIQLKELVCRICHQPKTSLDKGYCSSCKQEERQFFIRLDCLFDSPHSPLSTNGTCLKENPSCKISDNIKYCHRPYILYLGRIGNQIKVGISRKSRRGGYRARLSEQGLNEAIVVDAFPSLPNVLEWERWFKEIGYRDRIYFEDKIASLTESHQISLLELWPRSIWEELFPEKTIEHIPLFQKMHFPELVKGPKGHITGRIEHIQGPVLITYTSDNYNYWHLRKLIDHQLRLKEGDL